MPSSKNEKGEELVDVLDHPNWLTFSRNLSSTNNSSRVITYINIRLSSLYFSFHKNIFNHRNISLVSFFNKNNTFFLMNVYSDASESVLKYLKNTEANIHKILVITSDFNIRDNLWDLYYPYYSLYSDLLFNIADSFFLGLSMPTN